MKILNEKTLIGLVLAGLLLVNVAPASGASHMETSNPILLKATLTPIDSTPPVSEETPYSGLGRAVLLLNSERTKLHYTITYKGLSEEPIMAHFHQGGINSSGPPVRTIFGQPAVEEAPAMAPKGTSNTISGVWSSTDEQPLSEEIVEKLLSNQIYINIHTPLNEGGEIQGIVVPIS